MPHPNHARAAETKEDALTLPRGIAPHAHPALSSCSPLKKILRQRGQDTVALLSPTLSATRSPPLDRPATIGPPVDYQGDTLEGMNQVFASALPPTSARPSHATPQLVRENDQNRRRDEFFVVRRPRCAETGSRPGKSPSIAMRGGGQGVPAVTVPSVTSIVHGVAMQNAATRRSSQPHRSPFLLPERVADEGYETSEDEEEEEDEGSMLRWARMKLQEANQQLGLAPFDPDGDDEGGLRDGDHEEGRIEDARNGKQPPGHRDGFPSPAVGRGLLTVRHSSRQRAP